jgi:ribulose-5-phosphate 4-epimerase/fuculose-1-phosphate aldolase
MIDEGVIKFQAEHTARPLPDRGVADLACTLIAWRTLLAQTGLIGQDPARYGGAGFGNVSARLPPYPGERGARRFLVTGTQTGGKPCLGVADFCRVDTWAVDKNRVRSQGPILPSSEAMTHGAIYDLSPAIRFVFHGHCPTLWTARVRLGLPTTHESVAYGTPAMAREVGRLYRETALSTGLVLAMGGHEDGIVVFGRTADEAGAALLTTLARAYGDQCKRDAGLCVP